MKVNRNAIVVSGIAAALLLAVILLPYSPGWLEKLSAFITIASAIIGWLLYFLVVVMAMAFANSAGSDILSALPLYTLAVCWLFSLIFVFRFFREVRSPEPVFCEAEILRLGEKISYDDEVRYRRSVLLLDGAPREFSALRFGRGLADSLGESSGRECAALFFSGTAVYMPSAMGKICITVRVTWTGM